MQDFVNAVDFDDTNKHINFSTYNSECGFSNQNRKEL